MTETTVGREPVQIVEIQQPLCVNTFGVAPCTAVGTADQKCYNTVASCLDSGGAKTNFALGTPLSLYFSSGDIADRDVPNLPYIIPSLVSVSTMPTRINLAGANPDAQGLGNRANCTLVFADHPHTDRLVDPYLSGRSWNPMSADRGSFWSRWLVRNKYRQNIVIKVYEGYIGQALGAMKVRQYFLESVSADWATGRITVIGKDVLARIEERKAQAPAASPGRLYADIPAGATSFEIANAGPGDYAASGTLRIGDEILTYASTLATANGITVSGVTRGTDSTVAATHTAGDSAQQCLRYTDQAPDVILSDLLTTYGGIVGSYLDTANWATEVGTYLALYRLTALITEPIAVSTLISEICQQSLVYLWWDERASLVKMKAIRGIDAQPPVLSAEKNILAGSFSIEEKPRERSSKVVIHYNRQFPTRGLDDVTAYASQVVLANLESEQASRYGEPSIRRIFSRWLAQDTLAANTATKIITRFVDVPSECTFRLDAKDRDYWVGDTVSISHHLDVDVYGTRRIRNWTIVQAEEVIPGELVEYVAEDTTLYGRINYIMAPGAANYPGAALVPFKNCYIGNALGLLSDGSPCGRIS